MNAAYKQIPLVPSQSHYSEATVGVTIHERRQDIRHDDLQLNQLFTVLFQTNGSAVVSGRDVPSA